ncbi:hypothetical protein EV210_10443 [Anaerospora hongkongensis]|uniref:ABC-three component systems C-terminal domain-containing protein n=1 Tax=Anaerospora hongkongensis TaxID=244830 RepID=A0A4V6NGB1_9FIRM|nr:ABC-three component system protein [Anaerospora hongkongensis]TCL38077.1 hypothetical protein EV210_10443 [Anaerospora hongkongensis]
MMEQNQDISVDSYLQERKDPTDAELRLFLLEVDNHCPLCGKELQARSQKKLREKKFQIAHIYPNKPTKEQSAVLNGLERLGNNSESFENRIALCKDCHGTQDYHTTSEEYSHLADIKKALLLKSTLHASTMTLGLETEIEEIINKIVALSENEFTDLNYLAVPLANKFYPNEVLLKIKVNGYVTTYFTYIHELFRTLERTSNFDFEVLSMQIRAAFQKMNNTGANKNEIFEAMNSWIGRKTTNTCRSACEAITSFFVQNCEVFHEIPK